MRKRALAAGGLGGLGAALLLVAMLVAYVRVAFVDTGGFVQRAEAARHSPAVRAWLAHKVVEQLERTASPDLVAARPLVEQVIASALGADAIRPIYEASVRRLHRDLLDGGRGGLFLNLTDAGIVVIGLLRAQQPALAERIPLELDAALIRLGELELPARSLQATTVMGRLAPVIALGALLLLGLALALARDRWRALILIAAAVAAVGAVVVLAVTLGAALLDGPTSGERALQAVWWAFLGQLRHWGRIVGAAGLVMAGATIGAATTLDPKALLLRAANRCAARPHNPAARIVRALSIGFAGVAAVLHPQLVLNLIMLVVGAFLVLGAAIELVLVAAPPGRVAGPRRSPTGWLLGAVALVTLIVVAVPRLVTRAPPPRAPVSVPGTCNGAAALCDRRLDEVTFAGTHNSMSDASQGWFIAAQDGSILDQLDEGVRALLIDVWWGAREGDHVRTDLSPMFSSMDELLAEAGPDAVNAAQRVAGRLSFDPLDDRQLYLCHTLCELGSTPLVPELRRIADWLDANPGEVVFLFFEDAVPPLPLAEAIEESGLGQRIYRGPLGSPLPTLGALVSAGTTAITLIESGTPGVPWLHDGFALFQETPWQNPSIDAFRCDPARGRPDSPLFLLNHWVSRQPPAVTDARRANSAEVLLDHARRCQTERRQHPNIVAVDFFAEGDLFEVVRALNGVGAPRP